MRRVLPVVCAVALAAALPPGARATTLYGLVDTGELFTSTDFGLSWTVHSTLPVRDAVGLLRGVSGNELHLVSRSGSVYLSGDGGASWSAVGAVPAHDVVAMDVALDPQNTLLALTATGTLWASTDGGASFTGAAALPAPDQVSLTHDAAGNLYALTETGTVRESTDHGVTWTAKGVLPVSDAVEAVAFGADLLALSGAGDVWRSQDAGASWSATGTLSQVHMSGMMVGAPGRLYAVTREGEVALSVDGTAWVWAGTINQLNVVALATDLPPTGVDVTLPVTERLLLSAPQPNPSRGGSTFRITLASPDIVRLVLYDVRGRRVAERDPEAFGEGVHGIWWDPGV
ncbi:MAG TPA: hypothetical protein VKU85_09370, partial [bacterium]|nr:hypothetical protein [bacterium]